MERTFYQIEFKDDRGIWHRGEIEYDSAHDCREEMAEIIKGAEGRWRIVEVVIKETIVAEG